MNFPVLNGGLIIAVLAGLLMLLLRNDSKERPAVRVTTPRRSLGRRLTGWTSLVTLTVTLSSLFFIGQSDDAWMIPAGFGLATALLFASNLVIARVSSGRLKNQGASRANRAVGKTSRLNELVSAQEQLRTEEQALLRSRDWDPQSIPSQLYRSDEGVLEQPDLAEIVSIDEFSRSTSEKYGVNLEVNAEATRINLDEILRRRRANGN